MSSSCDAGYALDDNLLQIVFTNAQHATPTISFTYDAVYNRRATMSDASGSTTYAYGAVGVLGALQVASIDGPLSNDTITFDYDELGRVTGRAVNGVSATQSYDALGRVTSETNPLGTFPVTYVGVTRRVASVTYSNGQTTTYAYYGNSGDNRLQTIHNKRPDSSTLSKFDYTFDAMGNVSSWVQQADTAAPTVNLCTYDPSDQLTTAVQTTADLMTTLKRYAYTYDPGATARRIRSTTASAARPTTC